MALATSIAAMLALSIVSAPPAAAATITRNCSSVVRMCIHFNSVPYGLNAEFGSDTGVYSFNPSVNGGDYYLFTAGSQGSAGAGQNVWNNAAGARNLHDYMDFRVYYNSGYMGYSDLVKAGWVETLSYTANDNASMAWE